ncbi:unnamed protein product [Durusdinium trenchii]|uniref:Mitochondrial substrate carrier family protein ucpB n=2 Tax=Durusdinium trenchii TaxID=1381693 RepID=A0ABP0R7M3_9DINO
MGHEMCGYQASFTEELGSLVLTLQSFDRPLDEHFRAELAADLAKSLATNSFLPTLGVAATKPATVAAAQQKGLAGAGLALGAASTVATGGSSLFAVGFAAAAAGVGAHAAMLEDPTTPSVGHPFGTADLEIANSVATLKAMIKHGIDLHLCDEMSAEEHVLATEMVIALSKRSFIAASFDDLPSLVIPLGSFGEENPNPLLASMMTCAIALITDSIAAGGEINGYMLRSVTVRGSRGCALTFRRANTCSIL